LDEGKHEGEVAIDAVLGLEDVCRLNAFPRGGELNENTVLGDALLFVQLHHHNEYTSTKTRAFDTYINNVQSLLDGGLCVKREAGVDLSGYFAGHNLQNLFTELSEQAVECGIDLLVNVAAMAFAVLDGVVDQLCVLGLLRRSED
jgi:hypothetical protein